MQKEKYIDYVRILKEELIPAMGCTEPIALAYASSLCGRTRGELPQKCSVKVSGNLIKNVKSVIVPNTGGLKGIEAAIAAGIVADDPGARLEVLSSIREEQHQEITDYLGQHEIKVDVAGTDETFYIDLEMTGQNHCARVVMAAYHTNVVLLEKDGVVLNKSKTKAKIEKIAPGSAFGLQAIVTLPEDIKDQELLNEVTVTTQETGDQTVSSQAKVQIRQAEEKKEDSVDTDNEETLNAGESYPASSHPKTGDPYQPFLWLAMIPGSLLAAGWIRSKM